MHVAIITLFFGLDRILPFSFLYAGKIPCDPCVELLVTCQKLTSLELISTNLSPQSLLAVLKQLHNLRALELKEMAFPDIRVSYRVSICTRCMNWIVCHSVQVAQCIMQL